MSNVYRDTICIDIAGGVKGEMLVICVLEDTYDVGNERRSGYTYRQQHDGQDVVVKRTVRESGTVGVSKMGGEKGEKLRMVEEKERWYDVKDG